MISCLSVLISSHSFNSSHMLATMNAHNLSWASLTYRAHRMSCNSILLAIGCMNPVHVRPIIWRGMLPSEILCLFPTPNDYEQLTQCMHIIVDDMFVWFYAFISWMICSICRNGWLCFHVAFTKCLHIRIELCLQVWEGNALTRPYNSCEDMEM